MDYIYYSLLSWWIIPIPVNFILSLLSGSGPGCLIILLLLPLCLIIALFFWPPFWYFVIGIGIISILIEFIKKNAVLSVIIGFLLLFILVAAILIKNMGSNVKNDEAMHNYISNNPDINKNENTNDARMNPENTWQDAIKNENFIIDESKNHKISTAKYSDVDLSGRKKKNKYPARVCILKDTNYIFNNILTSGVIIVDDNNYPYVYIEYEYKESDIKINVMYHDGNKGTIVGVYNWNGIENKYEANKFKKWMYSNVFE